MTELVVKSSTPADATFSATGTTVWNAGMAPSTGQLSVPFGGTGAATLTGLLQGAGTSAITVITNSSTVGQILRVTGAATYAWGALDLADTDAVTGQLPTANVVNLSGTNTGDQTSIAGITGTIAQFNTACTDADFATGGGTATGTNTGDQNLFGTFSVSGQSDVVADTTSDTLTLVAGSGVTITTNAGTDSITIAASGSMPNDFMVFRDFQFGGF